MSKQWVEEIMNNSIKHCSKCLSVLGDKVVRDSVGRKFCSVGCRRDFYAEIRKEMDCRYKEWIMEE